MDISEKYSLKWDQFYNNISSTFTDLRAVSDFSDVTLASEDGHFIEAHKIILSSGSIFFRNLLKLKVHSTPLIFMRGLKGSDLNCIVDFLYNGEVKIHQEDLENFLQISEELQLKGLTSTGDISVDEINTQSQTKESQPNKQMKEETSHESKNCALKKNETFRDDSRKTSDMVPIQDVTELNEKTAELIEWNVDHWTCTVCGKAGDSSKNSKANLRRHAQIHLGGLTYPCNLCGKTFRCKANFDNHRYKAHKLSFQDQKQC